MTPLLEFRNELADWENDQERENSGEEWEINATSGSAWFMALY